MEMITKNQPNLIVSKFRISLIKVKKTISLLRAVSYFSLLLVLSSLVVLLLHSLKSNLSAFCISFHGCSSHGRTYVFLLCNGILIFIVKSSIISSPSNETDELGDYSQRKLGQLSETKAVADSNGHSDHFEDEQQLAITLNKEETEEEEEEEGKRRDGFSLIADTEEVEEQLNGIFVEEYEDEEGQEEEKGDELPSTEELNKKCEEFIRRRKAEIRSELMITF